MRKSNILPPDTFVRDNIKFIRMLGKKATNVDIVKMVRDEAVRQHISVGCEYSEAQRLADEYLQRGSTADQMFMLLCGNNWYWGGRQVYRFDDALSELLSSQTKEDIEIDVSAINQLPCSDFFVMRSSGDGSIGHGRDTRCKAAEKIGNIISNFKDTCNHKYSRAIINFAVAQKAEYIVIENMSGISENNLFLKSWSYYDLQNKIKYKAAEVGIKVKIIDPQYTSRRCSKCGHINIKKTDVDANRMFICEECGKKADFDYNAAKNIAETDIEKIISMQKVTQGIGGIEKIK